MLTYALNSYLSATPASWHIMAGHFSFLFDIRLNSVYTLQLPAHYDRTESVQTELDTYNLQLYVQVNIQTV